MSEIKINNIPVITENNGSVSVTTSTIDANGIILISGNQRALRFEKNDGTLDNIIYYNNGTSANKLSIGRDSSVLALRTDGIERMSIDSNGRVTTPYQPSFLAYSSPSKDSSNYVYNFGIVAHNVGNHYNNSNGIFTAPISGTYLFTASIWAVAGQNDNLLFYVNGNEIVGGHIYANGVASSGYVTMIAQIIAGDPVQLKVNYSIQGSQPRNYFSGMLIG